LWQEGLFLTPHHFQQWNDYQDNRLESRISSIVAFDWGLTELDVNVEGLANGQISLVSCRGVLPGGEIFALPGTEELPPARELRDHVQPGTETLDVFLALPARRSGSPNVSPGGGAGAESARYIQDSILVADENTGGNEQDVGVARRNFRLIFGPECDETDTDRIQIARLRQTGEGLMELDDSYIPPCLHVGASQRLKAILLRLIEVLHAKSSSLSEQRSQRSVGLAEFGTSDIGSFWLLNIVNTFIPALEHFDRNPRAHPEIVFLSMAQLAGALMTFAPTGHPKDLPKYNHLDLQTTFSGLEDSIHSLLGVVVPVGAIQIPLEKESESKFTGRIADDQVLDAAQVFLAGKADVPEHQLIDELQKQSKISSIDKIDSLLGLALPGVALDHCPVPPAPLRVKLGYQYFRLEIRGDPESRKHWDEICKARTIAIRIPGKRFPGLELELWSIKE
jgi:type VI secretion system protein ImpJ